MKDKERLKRLCGETFLYKVIFRNEKEKRFKAIDYLDLAFLLIKFQKDLRKKKGWEKTVVGYKVKKIFINRESGWHECGKIGI